MQQLIISLDYVHKMGICNRDIKLAHLVLQDSHADSPLVQLCDFGACKPDTSSTPDTQMGTFEYMAPEVMYCCAQYGKVNHKYNGRKADLFSAGVCLFKMLYGVETGVTLEPELAAGQPPENALKNEVMFPKERQGLNDLLDSVSENCRDFLTKLLQNNPDLRLTMDGVWQHPWFIEGLPDKCRETNDKLVILHRDSKHEKQDLEKKAEILEILGQI